MLWKSALYGAFSSTLLATLHTSSRDTSSYESDGLSAFASLDKRSSRPPANWNHYAEKGWKLYNKWEAKPDVNDPFSWSVRDECAYGLEPSTLNEIPRPAFDLLPELGIVPCNETTGFEKIEVSWPKVWPKEKRGNFTTCTNAKYGIFVAADNVRGPLPSNKNYSQIAWWTWQTAVDRQKWRTAVNDNGPRYQDLDYSGLRYFFRNNIANNATRDLLGYATNEGGALPQKVTTILRKSTHVDQPTQN